MQVPAEPGLGLQLGLHATADVEGRSRLAAENSTHSWSWGGSCAQVKEKVFQQKRKTHPHREWQR